MERLREQLREAFDSEDVAAEAQQLLERAHSLGMKSDWHGTQKELDFARITVATNRVLPGGSSVETGVLAGGTSALLIMSREAGAFHVSVDPYGLPQQSYWTGQKGQTEDAWPTARSTIRRLHDLADDNGINYSHYLTDSETFAASDLLRHPVPFTIVHLDGDHSLGTVAAELSYFTKKLTGPAVFVMDDHDDNNPGVDLAIRGFGELKEVFHRRYDFGAHGVCGFSAWLYPGAASDEGRVRTAASRLVRRRSQSAGRR